MKKFSKIVALFSVALLLSVSHLSVFAHDKMLNIGYDNCTAEYGLDGKDETWYWLTWNNSEYHISHECDTITYYFADSARNPLDNYTWTTDITEEEANNIKEAYSESMKNGMMYTIVLTMKMVI